MLKGRDNVFRVRAQGNISRGTLVIDAGSLVYDNRWISYQGTVFDARRYVDNVVNGTTRRRFFQNRNYAVQIIIGVDKTGAIRILEGTQVSYTSKDAVPLPATYDIVPLVAVLMIQDGSSDMNYGFKPLSDSNVTYFSGSGNVMDRNRRGADSVAGGITGQRGAAGITGIRGSDGLTGQQGAMGVTGVSGEARTGMSGAQGETGINWAIHVPFEVFF